MTKALVLGATSAIAQATARLYAQRGADLFLVARNEENLRAVCDDLRVRGAGKVVSRVCDLNDSAQHEALFAEAEEALSGIDLVLIAHGVLGGQREAERDPGAAELILRTNFLGPASLLAVAANRFEAHKRGCIVALSSVAGDRGRRTNYVYGAAKAGLSAFLSGLRGRLHESGVSVVTVKPGIVETSMTAHLPKNRLFVTPARVARDIVRAVERGSDVVYTPAYWRMIMALVRLIPERVFKRLRM